MCEHHSSLPAELRNLLFLQTEMPTEMLTQGFL